MKKSLFILLIIFTTSYSLQAQTKEETISWLQAKLLKYIIPGKAEFLSVEVTECFIKIKFNHSEYDNRGQLSRFYKDEYFVIPTAGLEMGSNIFTKKQIKSIRYKVNDNGEKFTDWVYFNITNGEENLYQRMQKAVDHLASFCPKKDETF